MEQPSLCRSVPSSEIPQCSIFSSTFDTAENSCADLYENLFHQTSDTPSAHTIRGDISVHSRVMYRTNLLRLEISNMSCSHNVDRPFECRIGGSAARVIFEITSRTAFIRTKFKPPTQRSPQHPDRCPFPPSSRLREETRGKSLPPSLSLSLSLSLGILRTKVTPQRPARAWIRTRARVHRRVRR